jgi:hypothetical protein
MSRARVIHNVRAATKWPSSYAGGNLMGVVVTIIGVLVLVGIVGRGLKTLGGWIKHPGTYPTRPMHYKKHGERDRRI